MAKGDGASSATSAPQLPKQDQYSVMHGIMDKLGSMGATSLAPSVMPGRDVMQPSDFANINTNGPANNQFGQAPMINYPQQPGAQMGGPNTGGMGLPRMGSMYGINTGAGSMAPSNPQEMMRRTIMGKGTFGQ